MRICALETHSREGTRTSAVDYWRIINPLKHVNPTKFKIDFKKHIVEDSSTDASIEKSWVYLGKKYDILYSSYIDSAKPYAYLKAVEEKYGLVHIMDIDDNVYEIDEFNPVAMVYKSDPESLYRTSAILNDVEYVTVTTQKLKEVLQKYGRTKETFVRPNYIDAKLWEIPVQEGRNDGKVNIVYQGSSTHLTDIVQTGFIEGCLRLFNKYGKVIHFYFMGMPPIEFAEKFPRGRVDFIQGKPDYYDFVKLWKEKRHRFDIGVAPLNDSAFNECKSEIKYYEGAMSRLPMVLSTTPNYLRRVTDGVNGFLANNTADEWFRCLDRLVGSHKLRKTMGENAFLNVSENYTIQKHAHLWEELLVEVVGRKK